MYSVQGSSGSVPEPIQQANGWNQVRYSAVALGLRVQGLGLRVEGLGFRMVAVVLKDPKLPVLRAAFRRMIRYGRMLGFGSWRSSALSYYQTIVLPTLIPKL